MVLLAQLPRGLRKSVIATLRLVLSTVPGTSGLLIPSVTPNAEEERNNVIDPKTLRNSEERIAPEIPHRR